jgi:hypothetical protein
MPFEAIRKKTAYAQKSTSRKKPQPNALPIFCGKSFIFHPSHTFSSKLSDFFLDNVFKILNQKRLSAG